MARQTPQQILEALQVGNIDLDKGNTQKKTESIVLCIDYSHSNLSPEAQQLLLCLAPFNAVIFQGAIEQYTEQLQQQPALAHLPFERWPEVIQEAQNWGLLSPDPEIPSYLHLQPVLPYFLRNRLNAPEQATVKEAIETAFRQHYSRFGDAIDDMIQSKEPSERGIGQVLAKLEYENLLGALNLSLDAQVSILNLYRVLSHYLDTTQNQKLGLALGESILKRLEMYPAKSLTGELGFEFVGVIDNIAKRHLLLKQYVQAEAFYQKALLRYLANRMYDEKTIRHDSASIYHQLGMVAQEQRQWDQAKTYYQQALQIYVESQDRYSQARTYYQLGSVAQKQCQWDQAKHYIQQALLIYIEFQDRYSQARIYHQLGSVAQEQRQWDQAETYYQQALQIYVEFQDRYEQARTYHNLGSVVQEQNQWDQAHGYFLQALETFVEYEDTDSGGVVLGSIARLWQASGDAQLIDAVVPIIGWTHQEVEEWFQPYLEGGGENEGEEKG